MQPVYRHITGKLNTPHMWASLRSVSLPIAAVECTARDNRGIVDSKTGLNGTARLVSPIGNGTAEQQFSKQFSLAPYQFNQSVLRPGRSRARMAE